MHKIQTTNQLECHKSCKNTLKENETFPETTCTMMHMLWDKKKPLKSLLLHDCSFSNIIKWGKRKQSISLQHAIETVMAGKKS